MTENPLMYSATNGPSWLSCIPLWVSSFQPQAQIKSVSERYHVVESSCCSSSKYDGENPGDVKQIIQQEPVVAINSNPLVIPPFISVATPSKSPVIEEGIGQSKQTESNSATQQSHSVVRSWTSASVSGRPSWKQRYKELKSFRDRYGHCKVPYRWREKPRPWKMGWSDAKET